MQGRITDLEGFLNHSRDEVKQLKEELHSSSNTVTKLQGEIKAAEEVHGKELQRLSQLKLEAGNQLHNVKGQLADLNAKFQELSKNLEAKVADLQKVSAEKNALEFKIQTLEQELEKLKVAEVAEVVEPSVQSQLVDQSTQAAIDVVESPVHSQLLTPPPSPPNASAKDDKVTADSELEDDAETLTPTSNDAPPSNDPPAPEVVESSWKKWFKWRYVFLILAIYLLFGNLPKLPPLKADYDDATSLNISDPSANYASWDAF